MQIKQDDPKNIEDHDVVGPEREDSKTDISAALINLSRKRTKKLFQCKHCDYTATRSDQLKAHSRKHTGEMFQCPHCDYTTVESSNLKRHLRKHTGEMLQ